MQISIILFIIGSLVVSMKYIFISSMYNRVAENLLLKYANNFSNQILASLNSVTDKAETASSFDTSIETSKKVTYCFFHQQVNQWFPRILISTSDESSSLSMTSSEQSENRWGIKVVENIYFFFFFNISYFELIILKRQVTKLESLIRQQLLKKSKKKIPKTVLFFLFFLFLITTFNFSDRTIIFTAVLFHVRLLHSLSFSSLQ